MRITAIGVNSLAVRLSLTIFTTSVAGVEVSNAGGCRHQGQFFALFRESLTSSETVNRNQGPLHCQHYTALPSCEDHISP